MPLPKRSKIRRSSIIEETRTNILPQLKPKKGEDRHTWLREAQERYTNLANKNDETLRNLQQKKKPDVKERKIKARPKSSLG